jgi:hypothetical protein
VNAEFNWWLLIVGLVIGAGLVYLVLADSSRRDADVLAEEVPREATWIAATMAAEGRSIDPPTAERVLELHRAYLALPPPDPAVDEPPEPAARRAVLKPGEERATRPAAPDSALGDEPHVERDAPEPEPPHRDVDEAR